MTDNVPDPEKSHELIEQFELADEQQIIEEIHGRVTDKFVYEFKGSDGQPNVGLSYAGTNWAVREYAARGEAIRVDPRAVQVVIDPGDPDYVIVCIVAERYIVDKETGREVKLDTALGVKRQWRKMEKSIWKNGQKVGTEIVPDRFFIEKAFSKAQRNGKQALIPVDIVKELIKKALETKRGSGAQASQKALGTTKAPPKGSRPAPAAKSGQAAPPPQGAAPPGQGKAHGDPLSALRQRLFAALKQAAGSTKDEDARKLLKELAGKEKVHDMAEGEIRSLGRALLGATKDGTHELLEAAEGQRMIVEKATSAIVFPIGYQPPAAEESPRPGVLPGDPRDEGQSDEMEMF